MSIGTGLRYNIGWSSGISGKESKAVEGVQVPSNGMCNFTFPPDRMQISVPCITSRLEMQFRAFAPASKSRYEGNGRESSLLRTRRCN
ncbi:hypothetical protein AN477_13805 [Alicyclobacillus ferrooxydans]|uniref:Uncharacterized protein n=1 Tax=Alicyclobacillus ferrooxydans TaxID=471514 RepID=A0A0P9CCE0_9BACL|nr:hypothetical protein AN477_13805 [Alicyclobacillus ferrooxydans]